MSKLSKTDPTNKETKIIFLHHSTGRNLLRQGRVREILTQINLREGANYKLWDHDYNPIGITNGMGEKTGESYEIPNDNTDPDGLEVLFSQEIHNPADNALSKLLMFDVIIIKSCFPVSAIRDDAQLERYQQHFLKIRKTMSSNLSKLFIIMTPPPLIPLPLPPLLPRWTNKADAKRARNFSKWLGSKEFLMQMHNVAIFDFFDLLAYPDDEVKTANMLRAEYRSLLGLDSHPNFRANTTIAPKFVGFVCENIKRFRS